MSIIDELMRNKPSGGPDPPEMPVCREFERCEGCTYPSHGFVCWGPDRCMKTELEKQKQRQKEE